MSNLSGLEQIQKRIENCRSDVIAIPELSSTSEVKWVFFSSEFTHAIEEAVGTMRSLEQVHPMACNIMKHATLGLLADLSRALKEGVTVKQALGGGSSVSLSEEKKFITPLEFKDKLRSAVTAYENNVKKMWKSHKKLIRSWLDKESAVILMSIDEDGSFNMSDEELAMFVSPNQKLSEKSINLLNNYGLRIEKNRLYPHCWQGKE